MELAIVSFAVWFIGCLCLFWECGRRDEAPGDMALYILTWPVTMPFGLAYLLGRLRTPTPKETGNE